MNFESALKYLESFISYEKMDMMSYDKENFNLERFKNFLEKYDFDYGSLKYVHVAGSKGKGTVSRLIAQYLAQAGYRIGLYTSPHLFDVRERIWLAGANISEKKFCEYMEDLKCFLDKQRDAGEQIDLTYFEVLTSVALKFFVDEKVDFAVLEVGLGGRLDSTNVIKPEIAVLTAIEEEHRGILGENLSEIMDEKLGIIKEGVVTVVGEQSEQGEALMREKLKGVGNVFWVEQNLLRSSQDFALMKNAKTAYLAVEKLLGKVEKEAFDELVKDFFIPGHFDIHEIDGRTVIFDVAHTYSSFENLLNNLRTSFADKEFVFLISLMKGKDAKGIFSLLSKVAKKIVLTFSNPDRAYSSQELAMFLDSFSGELLLDDNPEKAFLDAFALLKKDQVLIIAGSHFLVSKLIPKGL